MLDKYNENASKLVVVPLPHSLCEGIVLKLPCLATVDALSVNSQPLAHLPQPLLHDGGYRALLGRANVNQNVP